MLQELGITDQDLTVEVKLVTTVYADGEAVLVVQQLVERTSPDRSASPRRMQSDPGAPLRLPSS